MSGDISGGKNGARRGIRTRWIVLAMLVVCVVALIITMVVRSGQITAGGPGDPSSTAQPADDPSWAPDPGSTTNPITGEDPTTPAPSSGPTSSGTPAPAAGPAEPGALSPASATDVLSKALAAPVTSADSADDLDAELKNVAVGSYSAELQAQWQEYTSQGWTVSGSPTVESAKISRLDADADPPTAEVVACVDSSDVVVKDAEGRPVGGTSAMSPRALHQYTLVQGDDGVWRISAHSFPNDPTC